MSFVLTRDPEEFMARAGSLVMSRLECNVMATVLVNLREGAFGEGKALFGYSLAPDGNPVGAAMRVMPYPLLTSSVAESEVASLTELWLTEDPAIPGVVGIPATARAIAAEWARASGGVTRIRMRQAMHELTEVVDPVHRPAGALRPAALGERAMLIEWMRGFATEAGVVAGDVERHIDARLRLGGLAVWEDGGPVSLVGVQPRVAGIVRIGPVYTPPRSRRRGYAGAAVAAACRRALAEGAERCTLFTDLANPTSNKIYGEVGFRAIADWEEHEFEPPTAPG